MAQRIMRIVGVLALLFLTSAVLAAEPAYVKKATRAETILASLQASGIPTLQGKWHYLGPFDNTNGKGFDAVYPPEKEIDLKKTYAGKDGHPISWKEFTNFRIGAVNDLKKFRRAMTHASISITRSSRRSR